MNIRNKALLIVISTILLLFIPNQIINADTTKDQEDFINLVKDEAINGYKKYKILPSLTIAQAILESSWGQSTLSQEANNLFGIKAYDDWNGSYYNIATKEYCSQGYIYINANFKAYNSINESIEDHNLLLSTERYEPVRSANNYIEACHAVYNCGYATSPSYPNTLIEIIEDFNLYEYDIIEESPDNLFSKSILESAKNKNYENIIIFDNTKNNTSKKNEDNSTKEISSEKKEDTNNIPTEVANVVFTHHNYWYVIYCLLQNIYPNTLM